jgi:hypothetical protein
VPHREGRSQIEAAGKQFPGAVTTSGCAELVTTGAPVLSRWAEKRPGLEGRAMTIRRSKMGSFEGLVRVDKMFTLSWEILALLSGGHRP